MDANEGHHPPSDDNGSYPWLKHAAWNIVPADQLPTAPGPMIYEGFVPQQNQHHAAGGSRYPVSGLHHEHVMNHQRSQYPPLDHNGFDSEFNGGPVQLSAQSYDQRYSADSSISQVYPPRPLFQPIQQLDDDSYLDDMSIDEDEYFSSIEIGPESDIDGNTYGGQGGAQASRRGRGQGSGRGPRRSNRRRNQTGGRNKGHKTGPRAVLDPGEKFNTLHKEATEAFIDKQDYNKALELILKAISINPEIYSAHVLLSEIYFARDDETRGIAALFSGAHASPNDSAVWHQLADVFLQRSSMDRPTMLKQASYCFQRLLQIDKQDHDARFQKAAISRELGHHAKALKDLDYLLQQMPHNSSILRQMAEVCLDLNDVGRAIGLYDSALEYQKLSGSAHDDEEGFTWADLIVYVDLMARSDGASKAIQDLKNIARWLVGREHETFWEDFTNDDREWDAEHQPRRTEVQVFDANRHTIDTYGVALPLELRIKLGDLRLKKGNRQEALLHFEWLAPEDRDAGAPLYEYSDLFLQVADALREVKAFEQALRYYEALYSVDACDDGEFWLGFGACSYVCEKRDQALHCYEEAKRADPTSGEARTQLSKLYADRGDREKALSHARAAITIYEAQLPKTDRRRYERKGLRELREAATKALEEARQIPRPQGENDINPKPRFSRRARDKARRLAKEAAVVEASKVAEAEATGETQNQNNRRAASLTPPGRQEGLRDREEGLRNLKKKKIQKEKNAQTRHDKVQQYYSTMCGVTAMMREGDEVARNVWMDCAEALVESFRQERAFYPSERYIKFEGYDRPYKRTAQTAVNESRDQAQEDVPVPSVESNIPTDFCGIEFTDWLDVFLEYAMLLANMQEDGTECYSVINAALDCNVWWHDRGAVFQVHTCWLACALALRDEATLFNTVLRWFMREYVFCTDTYRLFGAMTYLYYPLSNDPGGKAGQMNNAVFRAGPNQKYLFRQIVGVDSQLPADYGSDQPDGPVPDFMRKMQGEYPDTSDRRQHQDETIPSLTQSMMADAEDEHEAHTPTLFNSTGEQLAYRTYSPNELDIVLLVIYGQVLYAGGSFPNALSYLYRAYNVEPKNPIVLLTMAFCYIHQMLKRQNENRHMYLLQGWSFFEEYVEVRIEWAKEKEKEGHVGLLVVVKKEIEFNRARCWQMLGMSDLAVRSYTKMMDMRPVKTEDENNMDIDDENKDIFNMEAAYAMATMCAVSGDMDNARLITEKYLVIE